MVYNSPFRIDFAGDIWKNFYKSAKHLKNQEGQNNANGGILDNIRMLQYQIDDLTTTIRTLDDKLKRMEEPTCMKEDSKEIDIFRPGTVVYHEKYGAGMVTSRTQNGIPNYPIYIRLEFVSGIEVECPVNDYTPIEFTFAVNASEETKSYIRNKLEERRVPANDC